jgi:LAS superfamily LD-carboxypeptidase LdcB
LIKIEHVLGTDASHLCEAHGGQRLERETNLAFLSMQRAAMKDNVDISIASSYRDFERQKLIWNDKWEGLRPLYSPNGELLNTQALTAYEKLHGILTWSALPGGSRHHWGSDLDVYDRPSIENTGQTLQLIPEEYQNSGPCFALSCWLKRFAADFGFYLPYEKYTGGVSIEPWHLSYHPVAQEIQTLLSCNALYDFLKNQDFAGKEFVLSELPAIYHRYILNNGTLSTS